MELPLDDIRGISFGLLFLFSVMKIFSWGYNVEFRQRFCLLILIHYLCYPPLKCKVLNICFELKFSLWIWSHNYQARKNDKMQRKVWHTFSLFSWRFCSRLPSLRKLEQWARVNLCSAASLTYGFLNLIFYM